MKAPLRILRNAAVWIMTLTWVGPGFSDDGSIRVTADRLNADMGSHFSEFIGNVKAVRSDFTIHSDRLKVFYRPESSQQGQTNIREIVAGGNVFILTQGRKAYADQAQFIVDQDLLILSGKKARVLEGQSEISGQKITWHRREGRFRVEGRGKQQVTARLESKDGGPKPGAGPLAGRPSDDQPAAKKTAAGADRFAGQWPADIKKAVKKPADSETDTQEARSNPPQPSDIKPPASTPVGKSPVQPPAITKGKPTRSEIRPVPAAVMKKPSPTLVSAPAKPDTDPTERHTAPGPDPAAGAWIPPEALAKPSAPRPAAARPEPPQTASSAARPQPAVAPAPATAPKPTVASAPAVRPAAGTDKPPGPMPRWCLMPPINETLIEGRQIDTALNERLAEALLNVCSGALLMIPGDQGYPPEFKPAASPGGARDDFRLAGIARRTGVNALIRIRLRDVQTVRVYPRLMPFGSAESGIRILLDAAVIDTGSGRTLLQQTYRHTNKVDDETYRTVEQRGADAAAVVSGLLPMCLTAAAKEVCDHLRSRPWKGFVTSVADERITISAGRRIGLKAGQVLDVYDNYVLIDDNRQRYWVAGPKTVQIRIVEVDNDRARAEPLGDRRPRADSFVRLP